MEIKSIADCLDFIDDIILNNKEKIDSIEGFEKMREYFLNGYIEKSDEELVAIKSILS